MDNTVIKINRCSDCYFIWDAEHVRHIRTKWKIIGDLVGSPAMSKLKQNNQHGMPLALSKIEVKFILTHHSDNSKLVETSPAIASEDFDHEQAQKELDEQRKRQLEAQTLIGLQVKEADLDSKADTIMRGMRDKRKRKIDACESEDTYGDDWSANSTRFKDFKKEVLDKARARITLKNLFVQIPLQSEYGGNEKCLSADDVILSPLEELQYRVFCDLNLQRGMFVTPGLKFGGHFLAYHGDPGVYHSSYVVYCKQNDEELDSYMRAACGRTATMTKKKFLICSLTDDGKLVYKALKRVYF